MLANSPSPGDCNRMLSYGATACLSKETEARDVISSIHLAARGMYVLPEASPTDGEGQVRIHGLDQLTPREGEVLEQLQEGATNAEIADNLAIGVETVRTHARKIYRKLGIASRRELARLEQPGPRVAEVGAQAARRGAAAGSRTRSSSASCTAFVAAPLRRLSPTIQRFRQRSCDGSWRMRPTSTSSRPAASSASG